jgi:hypothetical protein
MDYSIHKKIIMSLFEKAPRFYDKRGSCSFKHDIEQYVRNYNIECPECGYLTNDEFKAIMIELGFEFKANNGNHYYKLKPYIDYNNIPTNRDKLESINYRLELLENQIKNNIQSLSPLKLSEKKKKLEKEKELITIKTYGKPPIL